MPRKRCLEPAELPRSRGNRPDGPTTLEGVLDFPRRFLADLARHDLVDNASMTLQRGVVITTSYSGMGGAETAAAMLANGLGEACGITPCLHFYSAVDNARRAQIALLGHNVGSRPNHVFVDVLDRLPASVRSTCVAIQDAKLRQFDERTKNKLSSEGKQRLKQELGFQLFNELCDVLDEVEFMQEAYCKTHEMMCCTNLRLDPAFQDMFHIEVAGTTCTAWSSMGLHGGLLDKSTLPCLVWLYSTRFMEPDAIVHENSPNFKHEHLAAVLCGARRRLDRHGAGPRCAFSRGNRAGTYQLMTEVFSPCMLGVPSRRQRRYTMLVNSNYGGFRGDGEFSKVFFRNLVADASLYMVADYEAVQRKTEDLLKRQRICVESIADVAPAVALQPGAWARLQGYMKLADEKGMSENGQVQERMPIMLCNLAQNPGYWNQLDTKMAPALLRNSVLFDIKRGRLVEVYPEHFLVMGYPTPCSETQVPDRLAQLFPFTGLVSAPMHLLTERDLQVLTGNGMHLSAVGAAVCFILAATTHNPSSEH